jgi:outer membrane protein TolC
VVDVALATARQSLLLLDNLVASQRRALNRATGLAVDASTEVVDVAGRPVLPPLDVALDDARRHNPLVASLLEEVQASDERLSAARRGRLPRFSASGGYDATTADTLKPNNYGSVGVGVEMDLGSFRREGEIAKFDAAGRRSRHLLERGVRDIEAMVRDTHDRVRERLAAIDTASSAVVQADENLRIRQVQFDEGRATSEDLLDASELATRQRAMLAAALYQAHARRAELQQILGRPLAELASAPPDQHTATPSSPAAPSASPQGAPR